MSLKWYIKNKEGRYLHFAEDEASTIIKTHNKSVASVFVGTRDMADGICKGVKMTIGEDCEPEQLIHVSHPG
jgi:hypothetical protein